MNAMPEGNFYRVLDLGYVKGIESWGSDERVIESARMSTNRGFAGWGPRCSVCGGGAAYNKVTDEPQQPGEPCPQLHCAGKLVGGDEKLLAYLYANKHMTPFEMCGMTIEVKAPIFVFREWHRHRTQSYNEMSARYIPLPDENYLPTVERIREGAEQAGGNRQAAGVVPLQIEEIAYWLDSLRNAYIQVQEVYRQGFNIGIPKELARLPVPVARYSVMRASANLRNWLAFMTLRLDPHAQWEIRQYAKEVAELIAYFFPQTYKLFKKGTPWRE